VEVTLL